MFIVKDCVSCQWTPTGGWGQHPFSGFCKKTWNLWKTTFLCVKNILGRDNWNWPGLFYNFLQFVLGTDLNIEKSFWNSLKHFNFNCCHFIFVFKTVKCEGFFWVKYFHFRTSILLLLSLGFVSEIQNQNLFFNRIC